MSKFDVVASDTEEYRVRYLCTNLTTDLFDLRFQARLLTRRERRRGLVTVPPPEKTMSDRCTRAGSVHERNGIVAFAAVGGPLEFVSEQ